MGERSHRKSKRSSKRKHRSKEDEYDSDPSSPSSSTSLYSSGDDDDDSRKRSHKRRHRNSEERHRRKSSSRRDKKEQRRRRKSKNKSKRDDKVKEKYCSDSDSDESEDGSGRDNPEEVVKCILQEFPTVAGDLEQLLQMIDSRQAVDIRGLSERALIKHLRRLFLSLNLKETGDHVFLLKSKQPPTLEVIGPTIRDQLQHNGTSENDMRAEPPDASSGQVTDDVQISNPSEDAVGPRRRVIGPEMPSAELLAAAAKLTEAEAELREAEIDDDSEFIGPPPPAVVAEAESSNEAERFEEITRIVGAEVDSPYDILGVNRNMSTENMKKRYWKLSLMVHPDKCSHPQAHQAFVKLNKAFKDLQDPDKRKAFDDKIKLKEEQEELKAGLKVMREAAQWRRLQGISMEGDDILLAETEVKVEPKRDEWMTTLPPERKPGMTMQSTKFSRSSKEGRGDTSAWTDTPIERAQKAKMNYLEAYNEASALASKEDERKRANSDAQLVDQYNKSKRSKSLVEKHKESIQSRSKKKSKAEPIKEEWEGNHPWKPWDREKDLTAGRQSVKLDADNMSQGLTSRFSSGSFQRNFL